MKDTPEIRTLFGAYKACFAEMKSTQRQAAIWVRGFVVLFFLPVIWPLAWFGIQLIKFGKWAGK